MRLLLLLALASGLFGQAQYYTGPEGAVLPDPKYTPGVVRTASEKEICAKRFRTGPYRLTTNAMKKAVCKLYDVVPCPQKDVLEIDHLCPLELGCLDDVRNLWPQPADPYPGFHQKDDLENYLKSQVCTEHAMSLALAQQLIMTNWVIAWEQMPESAKHHKKPQ